MKKIKTALEYIVAVFYRYYSKGPTKDIAYLSSTTAVAFLLMLMTFLLIVVSRVDTDSITPIVSNKGKIVGLITSFITFLPYYFLVKLSVNKSNVKSYKLSKAKYRRSLYLIFLFLAIIVISLAILIKINA